MPQLISAVFCQRTLIDSQRNTISFMDLIETTEIHGKDIPETLTLPANAEIAIIALGDCGSCSSWVILDAIRLEKMGIPTISICSDRFSTFAHELAKSHGAEDLRILSVKHPVSGLSTEEIRFKTLTILPDLKHILQIP